MRDFWMAGALASVLFTSLPAWAQPASSESVDKLLSVMKVESLMVAVFPNLEQMLRQVVTKNAQGQSLSAEQRRALDVLPAKLVAIMRDEMSWEKMRPLYAQIYQETFEQAEVDGMLAFYGSPTGQAVINKMPVATQKSMALTQSLLPSLMPRVLAEMKVAFDAAKIPVKP